MDLAADFAANLNGLASRDAYLDAASQLLLKLFPSDHAVWNSLDAPAGTADIVPYPYHVCDKLPTMLLDMYAEHPLVASLQTDTRGHWPPRRLSDVISDLELYKCRAFQDGLLLLDVNRQLMLVTAGSRFDLFHSWSLNRWNHDFKDNEVELAQHIQPILKLLDSAYAGSSRKATEMANAEAYSLTAREQEVMRLASQGLKVSAIGHLLGCSPRTIAKHLEHAYSKLGSTNGIDALRRLRGG
ncbi:helix-turn-helix transcriptional regulator [Arthrobacter sp. ISL-65]|uniref:helix-turn-helix transcriptional regulator n=1 Tax=Arthrobacter sp. ISL-65 TaxID=2819112 RepID=UPI001BEA23DB|nr:helix-turn-helix transcriptional regulator [Arthrobacter sp. ISL-65]MBT2549751.1 helix-turn-helix transcriptional regulator [Arthrobacter sp. ISL-65]